MRRARSRVGVPLLLCAAASSISLSPGQAQAVGLFGGGGGSGGAAARGSWASGYGMHLGRRGRGGRDERDGHGSQRMSAGRDHPLSSLRGVHSSRSGGDSGDTSGSSARGEMMAGGGTSWTSSSSPSLALGSAAGGDGQGLAMTARPGRGGSGGSSSSSSSSAGLQVSVEEQGGISGSPVLNREAGSVADVVSDRFTVPASSLGLSMHRGGENGARGESDFVINGSPRLAEQEEDDDDYYDHLHEGERYMDTPSPKPPPRRRKEADHPAYVDEPLPPLPQRPQPTPKPFVWPPLHLIALALALILLILVYIIAGYGAVKHSESYNWPTIQRHVLVIISMAPVHATCAFVCLAALIWYPLMPATPYLILAKDLCMVYVFASLFYFLVDAIGTEKTVVSLMEEMEQIEMPFPLGWTKPWSLGFELMFNVRYGINQMQIALPTLAILRFCATGFGISEGSLLDPIDITLCLLSLVSAAVAMYCVMVFYRAVQAPLEETIKNPFQKIMAVLAVVFVVYIQGVIVRIITCMIFLPTPWQLHYTVSIILGVELWLAVLEMVFGALLINHYFPWEEFKGEPLIRKVHSRPNSRKTYSVFV